MNVRDFSDSVCDSLMSLKDKETITIDDTLTLFEKRFRLTDIGRNLVDLIKKGINDA